MQKKNPLYILINSQYVSNRHANKQIVNSESGPYTKVSP